MHGLEHGRKLRALGLRDPGEHVAVEVHRAALIGRLGEDHGGGDDLGVSVVVHAYRHHHGNVLIGAPHDFLRHIPST